MIGGVLTVPAIVGVTMAGVGVLGAAGRLPYGHWAGLRLPSTLRSRRAWEAAHHAGAAWLIAGGVGGLLAGLLVSGSGGGPFGARSRWDLLGEAGFTLVATLIGRHAARSVTPPGDRPHDDPPAGSPPDSLRRP